MTSGGAVEEVRGAPEVFARMVTLKDVEDERGHFLLAPESKEPRGRGEERSEGGLS